MKTIKSNLQWIICLMLCVGLLLYAYGCEPTTASLRNPTIKVTALELDTEFEILLLEHESRTRDLEHQQEIRKLILEQSIRIAETGAINPTGLIITILGILGSAAIVDDVRLRKKIKKQ